jgi:hypothetical protein
MYCPTTAYAMNVLSIMKMLSNASNSSGAAKDGKTFGFSVKDILDLPNNKSKTANTSNCSPLTTNGNGVPPLEPNSSDNFPSSGANTSGYHPAAAALYYNPGICDNPYARCLPYEMFPYSTQLRKFILL